MTEQETYHIPVLLTEVIEWLQVERGKKYIDATLGGGGHTQAILSLGGKVLGIDQDDDALNYVENKIKNEGKYALGTDIVLAKGNFSKIDIIAKEHGFDQVAGILFDLGVSSHQINTGSRGFSFQREGTLDMRMDKNTAVTAKDLINGLTRYELTELLLKLGEEYRAKSITEAIVRAREKKPIETTSQLARIVAQGVGISGELSKKMIAQSNVKVFQALRIAVNDEIHGITEAIPKAYDLLANNGRLAVISFHSLEDRIAKKSFEEFEKTNKGKVLTKKPITANTYELEANDRSRSAKLRVFAKQTDL